MKHIYILFVCILFSTHLRAQNIHMNVMDATTGKPIAGAKIKSIHTRDFITFTNDSGYFSFDLVHNDTILIEKEMYYPIFVRLYTRNFDSTHVIHVNLFPSAKNFVVKNEFSKMNLQSFDYHFLHDEIGAESMADITILQPKDAVMAQQVWTGKPLKIISIDIDVLPNPLKPKNHYILTPPEE